MKSPRTGWSLSTIISLFTFTSTTDTDRTRKTQKVADAKRESEINRLHRQNLSYFFPSIKVCDGILLQGQGKKRERKKEKGRRQVEASTAIYPMQSEIIAYHSVLLVSSIKALRRVL